MSDITDAELVAKAMGFARSAFVKKYGEEKTRAHIVHAAEVAEILREAGGTAVEQAAGYLHDVVEDTDERLDSIDAAFDSKIFLIVEDCTDPETWKFLPTLERKKLQAERIRTCPRSSQRVKLADQISNLRRLSRDGPPPHWPKRKLLEWMEGALLVGNTICTRLNGRNKSDIKLIMWFRQAFEKAAIMYTPHTFDVRY